MSRKGPFLVAGAALAVIAAIVMAMFSAHHNATASIPTPPSQGDTKVNPKDGLTYVWVPAGTFEMGCSPEDSECESDERPAHTVTITTGFWMGQTEVTQRAHQKVMRTNPSNFHGDRLPVEQVTWDDSDAFCRAVGMRLPTEAEWEYAARAGSTATRYSDVDAIAWYSGNSAFQTHAVGQKQPNAWKLYDMLGNAWEWVGDWYDENYYSQSPSEDPRGPSSGQHRTARGGAWNQLAMVNRVSHRLKIDPGNRFQSPSVSGVSENNSLRSFPFWLWARRRSEPPQFPLCRPSGADRVGPHYDHRLAPFSPGCDGPRSYQLFGLRQKLA